MESQQVIVYSSDVAAFVDALETIGFPVVETQGSVVDGEIVEALQGKNVEAYTIENAKILEQLPEEVEQRPIKRFRTNPKKQKEIIEKLFDKQKAVVTEKGFMNMKGNKRFKSDVWSWFGDIKLLISRSEAKKLKIPFYFRQCGDEQMMLSKSFVACFRCSALFIHDAQRSGTSTLRAHMRVCSRPRSRKKKGAPTIIFFPNKPSNNRIIDREANENDKALAHEQLLNFILSTESSFDIIKDEEFHQLLQMCISIGATYGDVNVESMLCPREKLGDFLLNDLYLASVNSFYTQFQHVFGATFEVDIWVEEKEREVYASLVCHFATTTGEMKTIILHTDQFNVESKSPSDVNSWFLFLLSEMPVIPLKRLAVVDSTSHAANVFKEEEIVRCSYQHLTLALNTVMSKALSSTQNDYTDFVSLVNGCKDMVNYFDQKELQYQLPEPLKICSEDNWESIIIMFRLIQSQFEDILRILNERGEAHLLSVDKSIISAVINLFELFDTALTELKRTNEPTLNIVIPWITKLRKRCIFTHDDHPIIQQLKGSLVAEINLKLTKNITSYHRIATMLDPRFRRFSFLPREDQIFATNKLKSLIKECSESPLTEDSSDVIKTPNDNSNSDRFVDLYSSSVSYENNSEKSIHRELEIYMAESFNNTDVKFNPLKFWIQHSEKYPNLYRVAVWVLSCPASCIQSDSSYLDNNWLVHEGRTAQNSDYINKILFVKSLRNM